MKIGFIGFGNMAQALASGLIYKNTINAEEIYATAKNWDKLCQNTNPKGFIPCRDSKELVENVEMVIIAVEPGLVEEIIESVKNKLVGKIVISVVANYNFNQYEKILLPGTHHLSTLPNTPVAVGEGIILCENEKSLTIDEFESFTNIFSKIALIVSVETNELGIAGAISGCGTAFTCMYIESLSDAAVMYGLPRDISYKLASQMVVGSGKLQLQTNKHPGILKDEVCSPGGITIVGVKTLERRGFRSAVIDAIDAIQKKRV